MSIDRKTTNAPLKIEIMLAVDEGYCSLLLTAMASILKNAKQDEALRFHLLDGGLSEESRRRIDELRSIRQFELCFYRPNVATYEKLFPNFPNYATFYRLVVAELLPEEIERVLYLDCDVLVLSSLRELWNAPIGDLFCAAAYDVHHPQTIQQDLNLPNGYRYFNAGVLLCNLKVWREKKLSQKFVQIALEREGKLNLADQDVLNLYATNDGYLELDGRWNFYAGDPVDYDALGILHYWGKYWLIAPNNGVPQRLLERYAALTPFKKFPHHTFFGKLYKRWIFFLSAFIFHGRQRKAFRAKHMTKIIGRRNA